MKKILCVSLAVALLGIFSMSAYAADNDLKAIVISTEGDASVDLLGNGEWIPVEVDMELPRGAILKTGTASSADFVIDEARLNVVNVGENTTLTVDLLSPSQSRVDLSMGKVLARLKGLKNGSTFQVRTPTSISAARGTGLGVEVFEGITHVQAFEDVVYVQGIGPNGEPLSMTVEVPAGWKTMVRAGENPTPPADLTANELKVWDVWAEAVIQTLGKETTLPDPNTIDESVQSEEILGRDISPITA